MNIENLFLISGSLFCLIATFFFVGKILFKQSRFRFPIIFIYSITLLIVGTYCLFYWHDSDFISETSSWQFMSPLFFAVPLIVLIFCKQPLFCRSLIIFILAYTSLWLFDLKFTLFPEQHQALTRFISALIWTYFACSLRILNNQPHILNSQICCFSGGLVLLYLLNALPFIVGLQSACLACCFLAVIIYALYGNDLKFSNEEIDLLGFIVGGLFVWCIKEGPFASAFILLCYSFYETIFALCQKLTFLPQFSDIAQNTIYSHTVKSGLSAEVVSSHIMHINIVLIIFACFQIYAPNQISLPIICSAIVIWQMYRMLNWNQLTNGIKDTSKNLIDEVKKDISSLKSNFNSTDKDI